MNTTLDHLDSSGLHIERVALDTLVLDPANARLHDARNLDAIAASLQRFGQAEPLVVQRDTHLVIAGNGRLAAMQSLGWSECDVVLLDVDPLDATALGIALNRTAQLAGWDDDVLARLLKQLDIEGALDGVGFSAEEIDALLRAAEPAPALEDPGPAELPAVPTSRGGDLWVLGPHRLLVGDSTYPNVIRRVMDGRLADLVWTDPPYGVEITGGTAAKLTIRNDDLRGAEFERFLESAFQGALDATKPGGVWYVAAPAGPQFLEFAKVLTKLGVWRQTLVWVKDSLVLGRSDHHYRHEALFYGWRPGAAHREPPDRKSDTVWEFPRPKASPDHPTMKPLGLIQRALETSSVQGELILDPFLGSGSTLLAAQACGRVVAGVELDPRYADVIVRRWQEATGQDAVLEETGATFDQVALERREGSR